MRGLVARLLTVAALVAGGALAALAAGPPPSPRVQVELLSEVSAISAGQTFWIGLRQRIEPGWHTYWMNPGDSGEPPRIEWAPPPGFTLGELAWPHPERIRVGPAMSFGYSGEVVLPIPVTAPRDLAPGARVTLRGEASWLVCEKVCIPEEAPVALTLPVASAPRPDARGAALIAAARQAVPTSSPWPASFRATADTVTLTVAARDLAPERVAEVAFYPARWGAIDNAAPQRVSTGAAGLTLEVARGPLADAVSRPLDGVLVVAEKLDGAVVKHAFTLSAAPAAGGAGVALLHALLLALAGGLVLNLMPCVLPVLSVKTLGLVQHAGGRAAVLRGHGVAYAAGVLVSFAVVAGALLALRAGGEQLGWGFQLQSPVFVMLLAFVLFALALSFSGVLVVSGRFSGAGRTLAGRAGYAGSFFTGALATVAATPCTAPFMGTALGYAATQPWTTALLVFEALGLGLALPFLLLTLIPRWHRFLPKPGPWMVRLQQALAFPLYASVAWLVWVVSQQSGPPGVAAALAGLLLIALAAWIHHASRGALAPWRRAASAGAASLAAASVALGALAGGLAAPRGPAAAEAGWEPFSPARLAELRAAGKPVFVNVTAAWCITCLVNDRVALGTRAVADAFARNGVTRLKADWTRRDPGITRMLEGFGRNGVPLYLVYPAGRGGQPTVLPQILSEGMVLGAIDKETQ
ncbi:MAG TPA: protein-disulfide reductase DsbD domain-containing protein [Methylomirabilota bacterium]|jgi:thiol:disulfide interchange protein DsbD|nr:protein-disulfide reductase DsbD domain-containing protein [Methylomirabilota bacterium]